MLNKNSDKFKELVEDSTNICIVQAENPDGDSLGSALSLEEVLGDLGKHVSLYCPVDIPKYVRYFDGWSRVTSEFSTNADLIIIVDTASQVLLSKLLDDPVIKNQLYNKPVFVIDHHFDTKPDLDFEYELILLESCATSEILFDIFSEIGWKINQEAATCLLAGIMSDTLGLTTPTVTDKTYYTAGKLTELGAKSSQIEEKRRELMKKSVEILEYKADLIKRVEYYFDGQLALVHIPWEDIKKYSDQYNPNVLILEELRLVEGVKIAVAIKTYPDGKLTGKIRSTAPVALQVAGYFGGGGHDYASGFRVYEDYDKVVSELINATRDILENEAV